MQFKNIVLSVFASAAIINAIPVPADPVAVPGAPAVPALPLPALPLPAVPGTQDLPAKPVAPTAPGTGLDLPITDVRLLPLDTNTSLIVKLILKSSNPA